MIYNNLNTPHASVNVACLISKMLKNYRNYGNGSNEQKKKLLNDNRNRLTHESWSSHTHVFLLWCLQLQYNNVIILKNGENYAVCVFVNTIHPKVVDKFG